MAASKSQKIQAEIDKVKVKISEQQARLKELEQKHREAENEEIVDIVRGMSVSLEELPLVLQRLRDGGTSGQSVQKFSGFGELPNKHFHGPAACENFGVWPHPNCLPKRAPPQHGMKKRRRVLLLRILRFFSRFHRLDGGFYNFQFFFVQGAQHGVNPLSALAPFILGRIEILIYRYIEHCHHLIKGVEAGVLAVILVIHDGTRSPVNNIGQLLLRHPAVLPRPLDSEPYIVKIKSSFISLNLHNIT